MMNILDKAYRRGLCFAIAHLLLLSGCTLSPGDGERLSHATNEVTFSGFTIEPGGVVRIEARDSAGVWRQIGAATANTINENTGGSTELFSYSVTQRIPKKFWEAVSPKGAREYRSLLRMRVGDFSTMTYNLEGQTCIYSKLGTETDISVIGQDCDTGNTMTLIADAMSPSKANVGRDGWLCSGQTNDCKWRARLAVDPSGLNGCDGNFILYANVANTGDIPSKENVAIDFTVRGRAYNVKCADLPYGGDCGLRPDNPSGPFSNNVRLTKNVRLDAGDDTVIQMPVRLSIPAYASEATFTATSFLGRAMTWNFTRIQAPSVITSTICFNDVVGDAGG